MGWTRLLIWELFALAPFAKCEWAGLPCEPRVKPVSPSESFSEFPNHYPKNYGRRATK
jgi:hypothetical protein